MMRPWHRKNQNPIIIDDGDESDTGSEEWIDPEQELQSKIWSALKKLKRPIAFACSAVDLSLPNPGLQLMHHGYIGLPLSADDAKKIISLASPSPFGRGEETIIDESVRKCWELNPTQFSLENPEWGEAMERILDSVSASLGISKGTGKIHAELYKLLLYSPGAFFKAHRDSEKSPGMFATLVVCLPSPHEGGKLVLTHDHERYEFETAKSSRFNLSYAAWYADIQHEVLPVTSGYRLMLTYNVIRQNDLVVPSFDLAHERVQQLSTLLQRYNSQLENNDRRLPHILLHRLKHKYTQASLCFNLLKTQDLNQVQTLRQLSTDLGFDIYLATLELEVNKDDGPDDYEIDRQTNLKNIVELDGTVVIQSYHCPANALIDPVPQDEGEADEEDHQGPTGNAGCPATYWYRDTVAVLVPPARQVNFAFPAYGDVVEQLFSKLMQKFSQDVSLKPKLEQICELALKRKGLYGRDASYLGTVPPFFKQAAATALDLGRFELFDEACTKTSNKIMLLLDIPQKLGYWAAKRGLATMIARLSKGVLVAPSIVGKVKFLESVTEGFKQAFEGPGSAELENLKEWSDKILLSALSQLTILTKNDSVALGQFRKTMDWSLIKSNVIPIISRATAVIKIGFINGFISIVKHEPHQEQSSCTGHSEIIFEVIIHSIWEEFFFASTLQNSVSNSPVVKSELNANDLHLIVENTSRIVSPEYVETVVIPAMIKAIPRASKECSKELFIELVRMIIKNEQAGFRLPTVDAVPPATAKIFVQALLTKFLIDNVGFEPQAPKNWSLPAGSCDCDDCFVVNSFLTDPARQRLDFPCSNARRFHLHQNFTNCSNKSYDVVTIRTHNPNIWRITKNQYGYEKTKSAWLRNTEMVIEALAKLESDEPVKGRLEMYLRPYYNNIMQANIKELPNLNILVSCLLASHDEGLAHCSSHKRGLDEIDLQNHGTVKRTR